MAGQGIVFASPREWEAWLSRHHGTDREIWLTIAKSRAPGLHIAEALDVALCYGWIDSHRNGLSETHFLQRYSPRRKASPWSRINAERFGDLAALGRVSPPGCAEVARAVAEGRWPDGVRPPPIST